MRTCTEKIFSTIHKKPHETIKLEGNAVRRFYSGALDVFNEYFRSREDGAQHAFSQHCAMPRDGSLDSVDEAGEKENHEWDEHDVGCTQRRTRDVKSSIRTHITESNMVGAILDLLLEAIPALEGKQRELFELHYSLLLLVNITMSEDDPLVAIQAWTHAVFPDESFDFKCAAESPLFWVDKVIYEIIRNNYSTYADLLAIEDIQNEYFYVLTGQYTKLISTSQGLVKLVLLALANMDVHDGYESIGRNIFKLDWRLSLQYFIHTTKADFFFDLISQKSGLTLDDYDWLYCFEQAAHNTEFVQRYAEKLERCKEYEKVIELGTRHEIDVFDESLIEHCLTTGRVFGPNDRVDSTIREFLDDCRNLGDGNCTEDEAIQCVEFSNSPRVLEIIFAKIYDHGKITDRLLVVCLERIIEFREIEELKKYKNMFLKMSLE